MSWSLKIIILMEGLPAYLNFQIIKDDQFIYLKIIQKIMDDP